MPGSGLSFLKIFIKSSLDQYVLPGTLTGTEILLLYMSQWKRNFELLLSTAFHFVLSEQDCLKMEEIPSETDIPSDAVIEADSLSQAPQRAL